MQNWFCFLQQKMFRRSFQQVRRNIPLRREEWELDYVEVVRDVDNFVKLLYQHECMPAAKPGAKKFGGEGQILKLNIFKKGEDTTLKKDDEYPEWLDQVLVEPTLFELMERYYTERQNMSVDEIRQYKKKLRKQRIKEDNGKDAELEEEN